MIKLARSGNDVFCKLGKVEFEGLSRQSIDAVSDGSTVSLAWLQQLVTAAGSNPALLNELRTKCNETILAINAITT